jgi:hypothetical protein
MPDYLDAWVKNVEIGGEKLRPYHVQLQAQQLISNG